MVQFLQHFWLPTVVTFKAHVEQPQGLRHVLTAIVDWGTSKSAQMKMQPGSIFLLGRHSKTGEPVKTIPWQRRRKQQ